MRDTQACIRSKHSSLVVTYSLTALALHLMVIPYPPTDEQTFPNWNPFN